jgi:hypothetical protein
MRLEYTPTIDDLREATTPATLKKPGRMAQVWPIVSYAICMGVAVFDVLPQGAVFNRVFGIVVARPRYAPVQNLWATLVPPLVVVSTLLAGLLVPVVARKLPSARTVLGLLPLAWFLPFYFPEAALRWHPTVTQQVAAGFIPWTVYFLVIRVRLIAQRRRSLRATWAKKTSLRRPHTAELTDEALTIDDGIVLHRFRWAHFKRYRETESLLLVTTVDGGNVFLPKRAVAGDDLVRLRVAIQTHVADGTFLPHDVAFPVLPLPVDSATAGPVPFEPNG